MRWVMLGLDPLAIGELRSAPLLQAFPGLTGVVEKLEAAGGVLECFVAVASGAPIKKQYI